MRRITGANVRNPDAPVLSNVQRGDDVRPIRRQRIHLRPSDDVVHRHRFHVGRDRVVSDRQRILRRIAADDFPVHRVGLFAGDGQRLVRVAYLRLSACERKNERECESLHALKPATAAKLAAVAILALLFGGFALRAAMRLVNTATHSLFFGVLLLVIVVWIFSTRK
jgi:hypothetical protein